MCNSAASSKDFSANWSLCAASDCLCTLLGLPWEMPRGNFRLWTQQLLRVLQLHVQGPRGAEVSDSERRRVSPNLKRVQGGANDCRIDLGWLGTWWTWCKNAQPHNHRSADDLGFGCGRFATLPILGISRFKLGLFRRVFQARSNSQCHPACRNAFLFQWNCCWCLHMNSVLAAKATGAASQGCRLCLPQAGTWKASPGEHGSHVTLVWISTNLKDFQSRPRDWRCWIRLGTWRIYAMNCKALYQDIANETANAPKVVRPSDLSGFSSTWWSRIDV